jgi:hypothetical protein
MGRRAARRAAGRQAAAVVVGCADGWTRIPLRRIDFIEPTIDGGFDQIQQIALQAHQQRLAFGIPEPHVVLEDLRPRRGQHQSRIQHASKRFAIPLHGVNRWHQNLVFNRLEQLVGHQRSRRISPHTSGVGAGVAIVRSLVILSRRQWDNGPPIGNHQHADFRPIEPLFDDHLRAGFAKLRFATDAIDRIEHLIAPRTNDYPFAAGQSIRLDHQRRSVSLVGIASFDVPHGAIGVAKGLIVGRRNIGLAEQQFAKHLARLQLSGSPTRTKRADLLFLQRIDQPQRQRQLRPHDHQIHRFLLGKANQSRDVIGLNRNVFAFQSGTRISRRNP